MRMRRRSALPRCGRRSLIPAVSMDFHFSKWSAARITIPFSFRASLRLGCFLFLAGMDTATGPMSTLRRKTLRAGRGCLRRRWRSSPPDKMLPHFQFPGFSLSRVRTCLKPREQFLSGCSREEKARLMSDLEGPNPQLPHRLGTPTLLLFVSVAYKGLSVLVSGLESTFYRRAHKC